MLQETGTRETRQAARELKFLVPLAMADDIQAWSRARLSPDPHGSGPFGDEYSTTSLYFDTEAQDVYHRNGSFGRSKYRIRRYGHALVVYLERKLRTKDVLTKRRTPISLDALARLGSGELDPGWTGHWFARRLAARRLRPACQITYHRAARIVTTFDGPARLTVDRMVMARPAHAIAFLTDEADGIPVLNGDAIVELKFLGAPPAMFRELAERFTLESFTISKYRLSVEAMSRVHV